MSRFRDLYRTNERTDERKLNHKSQPLRGGPKTVTFFLNKLFLKRTDQPTAHSTAQSNKTYQLILPYLGVFASRAEKKIKRALAEAPSKCEN